MNIHVKTESGTDVGAFLGFNYKCKKCGYINKAMRLNRFMNPFITIETDDPQHEPHELICHKCDDVEKFTVELEKETV